MNKNHWAYPRLGNLSNIHVRMTYYSYIHAIPHDNFLKQCAGNTKKTFILLYVCPRYHMTKLCMCSSTRIIKNKVKKQGIFVKKHSFS